jgi:23S rRNA (uracil1939-C5)-methyltransferase
MLAPSNPPAPDTTRITRIGAEGDGIGHLADGTALFVPLTLPGEQVTIGKLRRRGDGWQAAAVSIDVGSTARTEPPCRHFGICGGCVLQHWQDAAYRAWKSALLDAALRSAGFSPPTPIELVPGSPGTRRRLDFAARRAGGRLILGLHASRSAEVVDLTACPVLHPTLMALIAPLRTLLGAMRAIRRQASLVINLLDAGPDLLLRTDAPPSLEDRTALTGFARAHFLPRVSWSHAGDSPSGASAETICQLRPATTTFSGIIVRPPPGAFLQATATGERAIVDAVLRGLPTRLPARPRIAELYAGCGTLTFALAATPRLRVAAYEGDAASVAALRQAINQSTLSGRVEATQRDLARQPLSAKELSGFAAVVLDPPHAGAEVQIAQLAAAKVPTIIYVSCNPATLARDAKRLREAGYKLADAVAIDQFLWSARLEAVCVFHHHPITAPHRPSCP